MAYQPLAGSPDQPSIRRIIIKEKDDIEEPSATDKIFNWFSWFKMELPHNLKSGITVCLVSLPLSISLSIASGGTPVPGIVGAFWGGFGRDVLGSSNYNIMGPTGGISGTLSVVANEYGPEVLPWIAVNAGILVLLVWMLGIVDMLMFMPASVVSGFTLGVALIMSLNQLDFAFGVQTTHLSKNLAVKTWETANSVLTTGNVFPPLMCLFTLILLHYLTKYNSRLPPPIIATSIGIVVGFLSERPNIASLILPVGWSIPVLQTLRSRYGTMSIELLKIPTWTPNQFAGPVLGASVSTAFVAILETLISARVADTISKTEHDRQKEVLGIAAANISAGLFGGIPASAALARTSLNIRSGATSKLSSFCNCIFLWLLAYVLLPVVQYLAMPFVAAIVIFVAYRMVDQQQLIHFKEYENRSLLIALVTAFLCVITNTITALLCGAVVALLLLLRKMSVGHAEIQVYTGRKLIGIVDVSALDDGHVSHHAHVKTHQRTNSKNSDHYHAIDNGNSSHAHDHAHDSPPTVCPGKATLTLCANGNNGAHRRTVSLSLASPHQNIYSASRVSPLPLPPMPSEKTGYLPPSLLHDHSAGVVGMHSDFPSVVSCEPATSQPLPVTSRSMPSLMVSLKKVALVAKLVVGLAKKSDLEVSLLGDTGSVHDHGSVSHDDAPETFVVHAHAADNICRLPLIVLEPHHHGHHHSRSNSHHHRSHAHGNMSSGTADAPCCEPSSSSCITNANVSASPRANHVRIPSANVRGRRTHAKDPRFTELESNSENEEWPGVQPATVLANPLDAHVSTHMLSTSQRMDIHAAGAALRVFDANCIVYRITGNLTYVHAAAHVTRIKRCVALGGAKLRVFILVLRTCSYIDIDGEDAIESILNFLNSKGVKPCVTGVVEPVVRSRLERRDWWRIMLEEGNHQIFNSWTEAIHSNFPHAATQVQHQRQRSQHLSELRNLMTNNGSSHHQILGNFQHHVDFEVAAQTGSQEAVCRVRNNIGVIAPLVDVVPEAEDEEEDAGSSSSCGTEHAMADMVDSMGEMLEATGSDSLGSTSSLGEAETF